MKRFNYNIMLRPEPEGGFTVLVPSLPGCITYGKDLVEARKNAIDAINGYIVSLIKHKESVPTDEISLISSIDLKIPSYKKLTYA